MSEGIELVKLDKDTHQDFDRANWLQRGAVGFRRPQEAVEKETTGKTSKEDGPGGSGTYLRASISACPLGGQFKSMRLCCVLFPIVNWNMSRQNESTESRVERCRSHSRPSSPQPTRNLTQISQSSQGMKDTPPHHTLVFPVARIQYERRFTPYRRSNL